MSELGMFSGFSQGGLGGLGSLGGLGGTGGGFSLGQGALPGLDGQSGQSGQSGLHDLAGMLADMLLGSSSGQGQGAGAAAGAGGQSSADDLLQALRGNGQGKGGQKTADGGSGDSAKELLTQVLMALFEKILGGDGSQSGTGDQAGGGLAGGGSGGGSGAIGGGGPQALAGGQGLGGAQGSGNGSVEDLVNTLMKSLGDGSLNQSISPTADGGGQVSQDERLKQLLEMIGQFMDSHPETFGTPGADGGGGGGGMPSIGAAAPTAGDSAAAPAVAGGAPAAPAPAPAAPVAGGTAAAPDAGAPALDNAGAAPVSFPTASSNPTVVNSTIKVGPGEVFDGKGQTFTAGAALGDGGQSESQKPLFELAEGATLKNVVIGDNGADGVHVRAGAGKDGVSRPVNVDNVHWTNVGEDALTVKDGGAKSTTVNITNSSAQGASDKIFQLNADATVNVDNFKAKDFGTFMRTNGGQQGNWNLNLSNISAENGKFSFVKSDSEGLNLSVKNIDLKNVQNAYSKLPESTHFKEL